MKNIKKSILLLSLILLPLVSFAQSTFGSGINTNNLGVKTNVVKETRTLKDLASL
jgi:hypothetical protein